jgi:hypothetical protein
VLQPHRDKFTRVGQVDAVAGCIMPHRIPSHFHTRRWTPES